MVRNEKRRCLGCKIGQRHLFFAHKVGDSFRRDM